MNARMFDEMMVEAEVWFQNLMQEFDEMWQGERAEVQNGDLQEAEDVYSQEE